MGRRTGAAVPTGSHDDLLAKETATFDLPPEELHHRGDQESVSREKTQ
jgi:hypothetical protein